MIGPIPTEGRGGQISTSFPIGERRVLVFKIAKWMTGGLTKVKNNYNIKVSNDTF